MFADNRASSPICTRSSTPKRSFYTPIILNKIAKITVSRIVFIGSIEQSGYLINALHIADQGEDDLRKPCAAGDLVKILIEFKFNHHCKGLLGGESLKENAMHLAKE